MGIPARLKRKKGVFFQSFLFALLLFKPFFHASLFSCHFSKIAIDTR